jgi:hypothetical protein
MEVDLFFRVDWRLGVALLRYPGVSLLESLISLES